MTCDGVRLVVGATITVWLEDVVVVVGVVDVRVKVDVL
jgi:hypothetical protein